MSETVAEKRAFHHGYLIAVANIVNLHGEDTIAEDVLMQLGISCSTMERMELSDYDKKPLRRLFREIDRKANLRKRRAA